MYVRLLDELKERWRIETQAALIGWHVAGAFADQPVDRPQLPEWLNVQAAFDEWLMSEPEGGGPAANLPPDQLDTMIAFGWRGVEDD